MKTWRMYMHTKWLALGLIFGLNTATQAEIALNESADSVVSVLQQSKYWGLIQPGTACVEQYQFLPSGDVIIDSNKEHVTGRYQYIESTQGFNLPALVISFETDNLGVDCGGNAVNQTGTSSTSFIKKESNQKIYFCNDNLGKNCPVYLRPES